jgi:chromosome partitioning protein
MNYILNCRAGRVDEHMIIATFNPKGGLGKTTTAVNVATVLAHKGKSVLLVDLEADLNASISLGVRPTDVRPSIAEVLLHDALPSEAVLPVAGVANLSLISGSPALAQMDTALRNVRQPEHRLADVIGPLASQFDAIILDAPCGFSVLALSVPVAAQQLVVPIRAEYLALESLAQFLQWYRDRRAARRTLAQIIGIVLTMVDYRRQATREIVDIIRLHNRRGVFRTEVPQDPRVAEAPSHGIPLVDYAAGSRATAAYERLTSELLKRLQQRAQ